jgi:hypothetical protein
MGVGLRLQVLFVLAAAIAALLVAMIAHSHARGLHPFDPIHFNSVEEQRQWFNQLTSGNGLCCSFTDGVRLEDPDWIAGDNVGGKPCERAPNDPEAPGHYCVRIDGKWYLVLDRALVGEKNRLRGRGLACHFSCSGKSAISELHPLFHAWG